MIENYITKDYSERIIPERETEHESKFCRYCFSRVLEPCVSPIYSISTLEELKEYLQNHSLDEFKTYHPEGYTFIHKLFWNYGRERFAHRNFKLALECQKMILYLIDNYPMEFKLYCQYGLKEDENHTPLHDYITNISFVKKEDVVFIQYLEKYDLDTTIQDKHGFTFRDYLNFKTLSPTLKKIIHQKQFNLKIIEKKVMENINQHFHSQFNLCEKCKKVISLYRDLDGLDISSIMNTEMIQDIIQIIQHREELNKIYQTNSFSSSQCVNSHFLVIEIWKRKLFLFLHS